MVLKVVPYGTPVLRKKGARVEEVTSDLRRLIDDMFETMYAYKGIGLAAQQVGVPVQLTVIDVRGVTDRPSTLELNGEPADVSKFMPLVLINPQLRPFGNHESGPEGCLSFPEIYADVSRPGSVEVQALNAEGRAIAFSCGGLLARAVQHETDHLHGILFIDRMTREVKASIQHELDDLQEATKATTAKAR